MFSLLIVVDPNTLNLDPDPGFWTNLDPDPGQMRILIHDYNVHFERKKIKIILKHMVTIFH